MEEAYEDYDEDLEIEEEVEIIEVKPSKETVMPYLISY